MVCVVDCVPAVKTASSGSTRELAPRRTSSASSTSRNGKPWSRFPLGSVHLRFCEYSVSSVLLENRTINSQQAGRSLLVQRVIFSIRLCREVTLWQIRVQWRAVVFSPLLRRMNSMSALFKLSMFIRVSEDFTPVCHHLGCCTRDDVYLITHNPFKDGCAAQCEIAWGNETGFYRYINRYDYL